MTDSVRKLFDNFLFKVKATWLIEYINLKILEPIQQAQQIADSFTIRNVGTQDNVEGIVNAFADENNYILVGRNGTRFVFLRDESEDPEETYPYKWRKESDPEATDVYSTEDRIPNNDDYIYEDSSGDPYEGVRTMVMPTQLTVTQQWPGDEAATQHTVYDSIMYIGGEEVTV